MPLAERISSSCYLADVLYLRTGGLRPLSYNLHFLTMGGINSILGYLRLAQLDRVTGYEPVGREFESLNGGHMY